MDRTAAARAAEPPAVTVTCPQCGRMLMKARPGSKAELEVQCPKCRGLVGVTLTPKTQTLRIKT